MSNLRVRNRIRRLKRQNKVKRLIIISAATFVVVGCLLALVIGGISLISKSKQDKSEPDKQEVAVVEANGVSYIENGSVTNGRFYEVSSVSAGFTSDINAVFLTDEVVNNLKTANEKNKDWTKLKNPEDEVYTFLQGPRSYSTGIPWGGSWTEYNIKGNSFGGFGCGLCCMANIYDTLSPYEVDPLEMFEYAKVASKYSPNKVTGAIGWMDMYRTLKKCGFDVRLNSKPDDYETFQEHMKEAQSMVAVVSSYCDDSFWTDTSGHYINIWLYNEEDDTVFLAEPGDPENNRTRIPLRYVYDALKISSNFQYLRAISYTEKKNKWKGDGITAVWNEP